MSTFTASVPKRSDVKGDASEVYAFKVAIVKAIVQAIENNFIGAVGTVNHKTELQWIFNPKVHRALNGKPLCIIGNASNEMGEFSLVRLDLTDVSYFITIKPEANFPKKQDQGEQPEITMIEGTAWEGSRTHAADMGNVFLLYMGVEPVYGELSNEDTKELFKALGGGYEDWADAAVHTLQNITDNQVVLNRITADDNDQAKMKKYVMSTWDDSDHSLSSFGPCATFTPVQSSTYPQEAHQLKNFFLRALGRSQNAPAPTQQLTASEQDAEDKAKRRLAKITIFSMGGTIDWAKKIVTEPSYPVWSAGMDIVLNNSRSSRPIALAERLSTGLKNAREHDRNNVMSKQVRMKLVQRTVANAILEGNLNTFRTVEEDYDGTRLDLGAMFPQPDSVQLNLCRQNQRKTDSEALNNVPIAKRNKPKHLIDKLGTFNSMDDFSSLCVIILTIWNIIIDVVKMKAATGDSIWR